jgi:hypothetical protein
MANPSVRLAEVGLTLGVRAARGKVVQTGAGRVTPVAPVTLGGGERRAAAGGTHFLPTTVALASAVLTEIAGIVRAWHR